MSLPNQISPHRHLRCSPETRAAGRVRAFAPLKRSGYTLLELLLALGLSVIVVGAIATATQVYMVSLTTQQVRIERKQLVRSIFGMIGNDLRAGLEYKYEPADYAGLDLALYNQLSQLLPPDSDSDSDTGEVDTGSGTTGSVPEDIESDIVVEDEVSFRPTLFGSRSAIMIDISRLPRLDQYNPLVAAADLETQTPSDVKSLAYFVSLDKGGIEEQVDFAESRAPGGLYRREIDRAVANYANEVELITQADDFTRLLAHEIAEIGFRYFDGESWDTQWDSTEEGRFPTAIEITLVVDSERSAANSVTYSYGGPNQETAEVFKYVVHLPVTDLPSEEEE